LLALCAESRRRAADESWRKLAAQYRIPREGPLARHVRCRIGRVIQWGGSGSAPFLP
jgi:hypothetical protein